MSLSAPRIVVIGSLNVDWIARVPRLPRPGETIASTGLIRQWGGKGANQAVAAARQGGRVTMVGSVGDDAAGHDYRDYLRGEQIDDSGISSLEDTFTGSAMIAVDEAAENLIIVSAGANGGLTPELIRRQEATLANADVVLLQWEVPLAAVLETLRLAETHQVSVVMNPSPWHGQFPWGRYPIHTLIVNEGEAVAIFGEAVVDEPAKFQDALVSHQLQRLVITRGAKPTTGIEAGRRPLEISTIDVTPIDTVGAGDAFAGAYAVSLGVGREFAASLRYSNIAGALATLKQGAQGAIPTAAEVLWRGGVTT